MTLLDTNIFIHLLKGNPVVSQWLQSQPRSNLAIPAVVVYELEYGSLKASFSTRRRTALHHGMEDIQHVPFDTAAALAAANIRIDLERHGNVIGPLDLLIAGTAVSRHASLATTNAKEFSRIRNLPLISLRLIAPGQ